VAEIIPAYFPLIFFVRMPDRTSSVSDSFPPTSSYAVFVRQIHIEDFLAHLQDVQISLLKGSYDVGVKETTV